MWGVFWAWVSWLIFVGAQLAERTGLRGCSLSELSSYRCVGVGLGFFGGGIYFLVMLILLKIFKTDNFLKFH